MLNTQMLDGFIPGGYSADIISGPWIDWAGGKQCFLAGTPVLLADGSYRAIEDIKVGDKVMCYDEKGKEMKAGIVTKVWHNTGERSADKYMVINDFLRVTVEHPFLTKEGWKEAKDLRIGETLVGGQKIYSIKIVHERADTYGMEVEPYHNYIVGMDKTVVHNYNPVTGNIFQDFNSNSPPTPNLNAPLSGVIVVYVHSNATTPPNIPAPNGTIWWHPPDSDYDYWYPAYFGFAIMEEFSGIASHNFIIDGVSYVNDDGNDYAIVRIKFALSDDLPYAVLDYEKLMALRQLSYEKAKESLGIERYNFAIRITSYNGSVILEYPKVNLENADVVASFSRNVIIFKSADINIDSVNVSKIASLNTEQFLANFEMFVYR